MIDSNIIKILDDLSKGILSVSEAALKIDRLHEDDIENRMASERRTRDYDRDHEPRRYIVLERRGGCG